MKTQPITVPTQYKACVIAPVGKKGFDVFDSGGRWFNVKTQKQAKWWAAIQTRLEKEFNAPMTKPMPTPCEDHTPKEKS
jgi:hypothetical protein